MENMIRVAVVAVLVSMLSGCLHAVTVDDGIKDRLRSEMAVVMDGREARIE